MVCKAPQIQYRGLCLLNLFPQVLLPGPLFSTLIMANLNLTRSAKSASKWTLNDLDSYNITLKELDPCSFFGLQVGDRRIAFGKTLTTLHFTGVATTLG